MWPDPCLAGAVATSGCYAGDRLRECLRHCEPEVEPGSVGLAEGDGSERGGTQGRSSSLDRRALLQAMAVRLREPSYSLRSYYEVHGLDGTHQPWAPCDPHAHRARPQ